MCLVPPLFIFNIIVGWLVFIGVTDIKPDLEIGWALFWTTTVCFFASVCLVALMRRSANPTTK